MLFPRVGRRGTTEDLPPFRTLLRFCSFTHRWPGLFVPAASLEVRLNTFNEVRTREKERLRERVR